MTNRVNRGQKQLAVSANADTSVYVQVLCHVAFSIAALLLMMGISGCSKRYDDLPAFLPVSFKDYDNHSVGRFKTSYLADQIDTYYRGANPGPLGVTTFVNLDDLYSASTFGRIVSEQLMSELTMRGFDVVELRHSDALQFMDTTGELGLSRDVGSIRRERQLGGVIVGTYVASPERVYVNARLLDPTSSMVLSAGSVEMEKTRELVRLLRGGGNAPTLERIPVKHLGFATYPAANIPSAAGRAWELEESSAAAWAPPPPAPHRDGLKIEFKPDAPTFVEPKVSDEKKGGKK